MPSLPTNDVPPEQSTETTREFAPDERQAPPPNRQPTGVGAYQDGFVAIAKELSQLGTGNEQLRRAFNVSKQTLADWRTAHPEFAEACRAGAESIREALYRRAVGYDVCERKVQMSKQGPVLIEEKRHVPPEPRAAAMWLEHYAPKAAGTDAMLAAAYRQFTALRPNDRDREQNELAMKRGSDSVE